MTITILLYDMCYVLRDTCNMYLSWNTKTINDFSDENINALYDEGYVFTRKGKGVMNQTRSLRIDLNKFELSSENRRILRKVEDVRTHVRTAVRTLPYANYHWSIHKMGKDFYATKFGDKTFSANKIKELMTDGEKSNFNIVFVYNENQGYCIGLETNKIIHYSYPFYDLENSLKNIGMVMMLNAILYSKEKKKKYIYLGSTARPTDTYKLQFSGLEWFDGIEWKNDLEELKNILKR